MQAADRLQQIVELQTSLELQRQLTQTDAERFQRLEESTQRLEWEKRQLEQQLRAMEVDSKQSKAQTKRLEEEMERIQVEGTLQKNVVDALTTAVKQRTAECTVELTRKSEKQEKERQLDELAAQKDSLEKRIQLSQEEEEKRKVVMENQTLSIQALSKSLADEKEKRERSEAALEDSKKREDFLHQGMKAMQSSIEQIEVMLNRNRAEWQEMGEMNAKGKKMDSVFQKALSMNQLKEENRKLTAKVG